MNDIMLVVQTFVDAVAHDQQHDGERKAAGNRLQLQGQSATSAIVNFYLTQINAAISEVNLLPLAPAQLNAAKTQWLEVMAPERKE
jgi:hypothetical protein